MTSSPPPLVESRRSASKTIPTKSKRKTNNAEEASDLQFAWICTECREAECLDDMFAPLLICDGKCRRPFHPPCANLLSIPPEEEPWFCADCVQNRHQCAACKEYGQDDVDVYSCQVKSCGLFFHQACLATYNVDVHIVEEEVSLGENGAGESESNHSAEGPLDQESEHTATTLTRVTSSPIFRCPAHQCWTCSDDIPMETSDSIEDSSVGKNKKRSGKKRKFGTFTSLWGMKKDVKFRCLDCPISYHLSCIPPGCRYHELAMLCHEHAYTSKLPYLDAEYSIQAEVEAFHDKKTRKIKERAERRAAVEEKKALHMDSEDNDMDSEENLFFSGIHGSATTSEEDQLQKFLQKDNGIERQRRKRHQFNYCLPIDIRDEVHSKPPSYTHINSNRYDQKNKPKRHPPNDESCQCQQTSENGLKACGDRCLNRLSMLECVGDGTVKAATKSLYWNCRCGPDCGNRGLSKRQFARCRPMREHGKGWGLITINGLKKDDLVHEYVGEIIDEKTKKERLLKWTRDHPNDPNFYVMHLEPGWYIDAREVGNSARFINHSCEPNCKLVPFNVAGYIRVAIVCIKDVSPGSFLSYDYQFETQDGEKFSCRCGATNCRGTMKGGKSEDKVQRKTKKQLLLEAKARVARDKKYLQSLVSTEKDRLYLTGPFVPGENKDALEMVMGGPRERYRAEVQKNQIFLWRNAIQGGDFSARFWLKVNHKQCQQQFHKPTNVSSTQCGPQTVDVIAIINKSIP